MQEPETVYNDRPKGLGDNPEAGEYIPKDVGNRLAGAPLGPNNFGAGGTSDLRLLRRAARNGWVITDRMKESVPDWLEKIVGDDELDPRARVGAAKVLVEMDKANQTREEAENGGQRVNIDVTSGGKPLGQPDLSSLTDAEIERLIAEREKGLPSG